MLDIIISLLLIIVEGVGKWGLILTLVKFAEFTKKIPQVKSQRNFDDIIRIRCYKTFYREY